MSNYTLQNIEQLTATSIRVRLKPSDSKNTIKPRAGQYVGIVYTYRGRLSPMRCFSVVNTANNDGILEFGMRVHGRFTRSVQKLKVGTDFTVQGPYGSFVVDPAYDKKCLMLAAGIGITPLLSIITDVTSKKLPVDMTLLYNCRSFNEIAYYKILTNLQAHNGNLKVQFLVGPDDSVPVTAQNVSVGRITPQLIKVACGSDFTKTSFFMCGPPNFMTGMSQNLLQAGAPPERIVSESFAIKVATAINGKPWFRRLSPIFLYCFLGFMIILGVIVVRDVADNTPATTSSSQIQTA
jgi:ferredoxin-NADP reductase